MRLLDSKRRASIVGLAAVFASAGVASAANFVNLDFSSTSGTLLDKDTQGTGFNVTERLPLTGTTRANPDLGLDIDTTAGTLTLINVPNADFNGGANLSNAQAPGVFLPTLGFTSTQDFVVSATFVGNPVNDNVEQVGVYIGADGQNLYRLGLIQGNFAFEVPTTGYTPSTFGQGQYVYTAPTQGGIDTAIQLDDRYVPAPSDIYTLTLSRVGGIYTANIQNGSVNAFIDVVQPTYLNGNPNLYVGIYGLDTVGLGDPLSVVVTNFYAAVPEPSMIGAILAPLAMLGMRRRRAR